MRIWEMSFFGAVVILVVVVIRALAINRLPKKTFLALWGIALVRLLIPYSLSSAFSVYSLLGRLTSPAETAFGTGVPAVQPVTIAPRPNTGVASFASSTRTASHVAGTCMFVWAIGVLICAVLFTIIYLKCRWEFRESLPIDNSFVRDWLEAHQLRRTIQIRQSDKITAPLTYGVFHPVILLSKSTDWRDEKTLAYVLTHEYVHIRRFDAVSKLSLTASLCLHWFNPAVWLMYVLANRDIELSCDEAVIRLFGERTKSAYAMTLIRMEETRSGLRPLCNNFSKHAIEERIIAIMKMKKTSWVAVLIALTLIVGVTTAFATTGKIASVQTPNENTISAYDNVSIFEGNRGMDAQNAKLIANSEWFSDYEEYGLGYDEQQGVLLYDGQIVSLFHDEMALGVYTHVTFNQGTVGIEVQRDADWKITGLTTRATPTDGTAVQEGTLEQTAVTGATPFFDEDTHEPTQEELLADYGNFGISFDASGKMLYQGRLVRWFADYVELEEGILLTQYVYRNDEGTEYIHTVRDRIDNGDGSYDPFGPLTGIVPWETGKHDDFGFLFQGNQINEATEVSGSDDASGTTFEERFAKYKAYGITYVEANGVSGRGNVYLNGQLVSHFADVTPNGNAFSFSSAERGGINVRTFYDINGNLSGVETVAN